ncbi:MAG TPA: 3-hydroxyacyl-CoA dehydrogenase family protein [Puia sp.]|nr:3-hydroxyacyl-CoA dehydrogenase family protein [Puia sp.]
MKIAVIAGSSLKKEMETRPHRVGQDIEWIWADQVEDLAQRGDIQLYIDLGFIMDKDRIGQLSRLLPAPVMVNSVVYTLHEIGKPFIRINAWPGFLERSIHELVVPDERTAADLAALYEQLGWSYRLVPDIPGLISARILAMIINEAYYTLQSEISTRPEIDIAMKLGTNYPYGPFEWSERIGITNICHLLSVLSETDNRYSPAESLLSAVKKD